MHNLFKFLVLAFFVLSASDAEAKKEISLTPYLKKSVSYNDIGKVKRLRNKADKSKVTDKKLKYYSLASQLGDYESQIKMGYYYGFGTFNYANVDFDASTMSTHTYGIDESIARYYLKAAEDNVDVGYHAEAATLGLTYLSLDLLDNPSEARHIYENMIFNAAFLEEYLESNPDVDSWPYARRKTFINTGKILSTLFLKGIGTERDLLKAHYFSLWIENEINMPDEKTENRYSAEIMKCIDAMPFSEEGKKYGVGLVSALLLKRAADIYANQKNNPEIIFWLERSLDADKTNSKAYYLAGCLYMNGEAGLIKNRSNAKEWYERGAELGSEEADEALDAIKEMERRERELARAKAAEEERQRQQRRQMWAEAIGSIVQAAGNAYMISQGYTSNYNNMNLLDPALAVRQVQAQNAQMSYLQQMSMQNIQMPQFDIKWPETPKFTFDWDSVDWNNASMDTYYLYQGDLLSNGAAAIGDESSGNSSYRETGSTYQGTCHLCHGLGKCWTCNGSRMYLNPLTNEYIKCPNCTDGLCSHCHGSGKE